MVLYPVVSMVPVDPAGPHDHPSRDARALASGRLALLLALEVAPTGRAAEDRDGPPCVDPADGHRDPLWGAPRIHGELLKLGIEVSQATISKYMLQSTRPPSQTWRTFLDNHADCLAAMDFFTVPTARFRVFYAFIVLSHDRRKVLHFNATEHQYLNN